MELYHGKDYFKENESIVINKSVYIAGFHDEHRHDFLEIVYISNGNGWHYVNGKKTSVQFGDLLFINFDVSHYFRPGSDDFVWMNCIFNPEILDPSLIHSKNAENVTGLTLLRDLIPNVHIRLRDLEIHRQSGEFHPLFQEMYTEYQNAKEGYQQILQHYLFILIIRMIRVLGSNRLATPECNKKSFREILQFLRDNMQTPIKLNDIARKAFLSPAYFSTLFKQKTGQSLTDYLHDLRIQRAKELLEQTAWSIQHIMNEVGYHDSKFFYEIFKRYTGYTPGRYRELNNRIIP